MTKQEQASVSRLPWDNLTKMDTSLFLGDGAAWLSEPGVRSPEVSSQLLLEVAL